MGSKFCSNYRPHFQIRQRLHTYDSFTRQALNVDVQTSWVLPRNGEIIYSIIL